MAVESVGMDVLIKFGASRSNRFRDIRECDFVSNERTNERKLAYPSSAKRIRVSPKNYTKRPVGKDPKNTNIPNANFSYQTINQSKPRRRF